MNQGKLEVVKQEMARLNINILRVNELKLTGMGEFNSDDHYIYYYGMAHSFIELVKPSIITQLVKQKQQTTLLLLFRGL